MITKKNIKNHIVKNENGSTLITVIVIVAFMSILATVMLYLSGENYKMKATDLKTKSSFYEAEEVVELMKTQLALDVAEASKPAYTLTSINYIQSGNKHIRAEEYYEEFRANYISEYRNHWYTTVGGATTLDLTKGIQELFPGATAISADYSLNRASFTITVNGTDLKCTLENFTFDKALSVPTDIYDSSGKLKKYHIYGSFTDDYNYQPFMLTVSNDRNYTSVISTSFEVLPPILNWGDSIDNSDSELDYTDCIHYYGWNKD